MSGLGRRGILSGGGVGLAALGAAAATGGVVLSAREAAAQSAEDSLLRTVLDRGKVLVGTGSTNAPWHFEDEGGNLVGMDITMARILAQGLFDDPEAVEFVQQDPAARIPNIVTGKVDIVIQFMTVTPGRAQLVNFTRPYYVEGVALLTKPDGQRKTFDDLLAGGSDTKVSILQNVDAEQNVHLVLPDAQVLIQAGLYDLATPFFSAEYTADQLAVPRDLRANVTVERYPAGHMMYFHPPSLAKMRADLAALYRRASHG